MAKMKRRLDSTDATRGLQDIRVATREESVMTGWEAREGSTYVYLLGTDQLAERERE